MVFSRSAIAFLILIAAAALPVSAAATSEVLPPAASVKGWQLREHVRTYAPDDLYEYIDGNADLFRSYGFTDLAVGDYAPAEAKGWVSVDVYNMGTPLQAFGIFGAERPPDVKPTPLGTQGYESNGLIAFWKGAYYVKVSLVESEDKQGARRLARVAAGRIAAEEAMPVELRRLPSEGRIAGSERYVKRGALGQAFLRNTVSAQYMIAAASPQQGDGGASSRAALAAPLGDSVATLYISDLRARGPSLAASHKLRKYYAKAGASVAGVPRLAKGAFAVRDEFYGEMVVMTAGKFVVIAAAAEPPGEQVADLARAGAAAAIAALPASTAGTRASQSSSAAAACPNATAQATACPIGGSCAAGTR